MCYSVMVETDLRKLELAFKAEVDVEGFLRLLEARKQGRKNLKIARGLESYFSHPKTVTHQRCKALIDEFASIEIERFEKKAEEKRQQIAANEEKLAKRWSKTSSQQLEVAQRVLAKTQYDIARLQGPYIPTDECVFQYYYAPLLVAEDGKRQIKFFRYQVRPRWADKEPNRNINMFNARTEMLQERKTWAPLFMQRHGALVFKRFYEWVEDPQTNVSRVIQFIPEDGELMWAPALHEYWRSHDGSEEISSFAILTRDPPEEVARMGHDRCPVFPQWELLDTWLDPSRCDASQMLQNLTRLKPVRYIHEWAA